MLSQLRNLLLQIFRIMLSANITDDRSRSKEDTFGTLGRINEVGEEPNYLL